MKLELVEMEFKDTVHEALYQAATLCTRFAKKYVDDVYARATEEDGELYRNVLHTGTMVICALRARDYIDKETADSMIDELYDIERGKKR